MIKENIYMRKIKFITAVLITVLLVGSLIGYGVGKVTAKSLLRNALGTKDVKSLDVNVVFDLDMSANSDAKTNFAVNLDCDMQATKDVAYTEGKANIDLSGEKTELDIKNYVDIKNKTVYTYVKDLYSWARSALDSSFNSISDKLGINLLGKLASAKVKSKGDNYIVTGKVSYKDIKDFIGEGIIGLPDNIDIDKLNLDKLSFNVKMTFDKSSKVLKSIVYSVDTKDFKSDDYTLNKFKITTTIKGINKNNDLFIPVDVDGGRSTFKLVTTESQLGVDTSEEPPMNNSQKNLAQLYLSKDSVSKEDIESVLVNYYSNIKNLSPEAMDSLLAFFNNYTADEFAKQLDTYDSWSDNDKIALSILYDIGVVDDETLSTFSISSVDIQSYVSNYVIPLR